MFKPTIFRFMNAVHWPGAGPTVEIHAETVRDTRDEGEDYVFIHASGTAVKVDKSQVTVYGVWTDDNVPNMPSSSDYNDGTDKEPSDSDSLNDPSTDNESPPSTVPSAPIEDPTDADTDTQPDSPEDPESPTEPDVPEQDPTDPSSPEQPSQGDTDNIGTDPNTGASTDAGNGAGFSNPVLNGQTGDSASDLIPPDTSAPGTDANTGGTSSTETGAVELDPAPKFKTSRKRK